jgi:hypothetical protein
VARNSQQHPRKGSKRESDLPVRRQSGCRADKRNAVRRLLELGRDKSGAQKSNRHEVGGLRLRRLGCQYCYVGGQHVCTVVASSRGAAREQGGWDLEHGGGERKVEGKREKGKKVEDRGGHGRGGWRVEGNNLTRRGPEGCQDFEENREKLPTV